MNLKAFENMCLAKNCEILLKKIMESLKKIRERNIFLFVDKKVHIIGITFHIIN